MLNILCRLSPSCYCDCYYFYFSYRLLPMAWQHNITVQFLSRATVDNKLNPQHQHTHIYTLNIYFTFSFQHLFNQQPNCKNEMCETVSVCVSIWIRTVYVQKNECICNLLHDIALFPIPFTTIHFYILIRAIQFAFILLALYIRERKKNNANMHTLFKRKMSAVLNEKRT